MKGTIAIAATALGALAVAACGSSGGGSSSASGGTATTKACVASIGMEGPLTGPVATLGQEQLHFAQLAVAQDNAANKTKISIVQGDTQLNPAQATTVTQQLTSNSKIVAVVGPAGSQEVEAVGPLMARAGMPFISGSATATALTTGKYPTFFRAVSNDGVQGPQDANYIVDNLHPKALMIVDDQESYSTGLVAEMCRCSRRPGSRSTTSRSRRRPPTSPRWWPRSRRPPPSWCCRGRWPPTPSSSAGTSPQQHKKAVIFGTDGLFSPGAFTINGSYVSAFGPDITAIPADKAIAAQAKAKYGNFGTFGPPVFAATHVDRRGDRLGLQVGPDPEPGQRAGRDQEDGRADLDPRSADQVRLARRHDRRQVLPLQDRLVRQVQPDHGLTRQHISEPEPAPGGAPATSRRAAGRPDSERAGRIWRMAFFFQELVNGITTGALYALVALGFSMVYGVLKLLNFAHGDLYMVGAYIGFFVIQWFGGATSLSIPVPLLLVIMFVLAAGLVGRPGGGDRAVRVPAAAGRPADRAADHRHRRLVLPGERGAAAVRRAVPHLQHAGLHQRLDSGIQIGSVTINAVQILVLVLGLILMVGLQQLVHRTKLGKQMRAVAADREAAEMLGVNVNFTIAVTFFLGSALAGVAGVMGGLLFNQVTNTIGFIVGLKAFTAAVVGGIGSIPGAMLGGLLIGLAESFITGYISSTYSNLLVFLLLIAVMLVRPSGLLGQAQLQKV